MCDTLVAPPAAAAQHVMLFGKNSDRQRNEAQAIEFVPRAQHAPGATVQCTYLAIPQVRETKAVLICRPFWMWGTEMGANEHGVVIGNEGLQARIPAPEKPALTGMDLVRLTLERAATAAEALQIIIALLEKHGQGGNCGHLIPNYYNNGFLIADAREGFVLETVERDWLYERVRGVRAMSNIYSVGADAERVSGGLPRLIQGSGLSDTKRPDFASAITQPNREHIGHAGARRARSTSLLRSHESLLEAADLMRLLRDHGCLDSAASGWHPDSTPHISICMHAGAEGRMGQTVGSMVSEIGPGHAVHWVTATAAPCISIFKPVFGGEPPPPHGDPPTDRFNRNALWWRHEQLHRATLEGDFAKFLEGVRQERDALEEAFRTRVRAVIAGGDVADRKRVISSCWQEAEQAEERWFAKLTRDLRRIAIAYGQAWREMNRVAGLEDA